MDETDKTAISLDDLLEAFKSAIRDFAALIVSDAIDRNVGGIRDEIEGINFTGRARRSDEPSDTGSVSSVFCCSTDPIKAYQTGPEETPRIS